MSLNELLLALALVAVVLGSILGIQKKITVYRNYDDIAIIFFAVVPLFIGMISLISWIVIPAAIASICLLLWITFRTWQDNCSVWKFLLALITKLALSILFIGYFWDLISPSGNTQVGRAKSKASAVAVLLLITPLLYKLVRDKTGMWVPKNVLNGTRRSLTNGS